MLSLPSEANHRRHCPRKEVKSTVVTLLFLLASSWHALAKPSAWKAMVVPGLVLPGLWPVVSAASLALPSCGWACSAIGWPWLTTIAGYRPAAAYEG
jgi:hypothetical protein